MMKFDVLVIGAGPAGMMAAIQAGESGKVCLIESNPAPGMKLLLTGGGRCNVTADVGAEVFRKNITHNASFMFSSLYQFSPQDTMRFFTEKGVFLKTEKGHAVFPQSDRSETIRHCVVTTLQQSQVSFKRGTASSLVKEKGLFHCTVLEENETSECIAPSVIVTTGGISYPETGSTGTGFLFAQQFGHTIVPLEPGLTSLKGDLFPWESCKGISLPRVRVRLLQCEKEFEGDLLITDTGFTGPVILNATLERFFTEDISLDFLPFMTDHQWNLEMEKFRKEKTLTLVSKWMQSFLPKKLIDLMLIFSEIPPDRNNASFSSQEEKRLNQVIKNSVVPSMRKAEIDSAMITLGGINVKEINPKTMESKLCPGLFFAGEMLDVTGKTGGYNLQIAFSTGFVAGKHANHNERCTNDD